MATQEQVKRKNKYVNKRIQSGAIRINLGENNHIDPKDFDSEDYNRALARAIAIDPFTRASTAFWMKSNRKPITIFFEK